MFDIIVGWFCLLLGVMVMMALITITIREPRRWLISLMLGCMCWGWILSSWDMINGHDPMYHLRQHN